MDETSILGHANFYSKGAATSPFQWFDQIQDMLTVNPALQSIYDKMLKAVKTDQKRYFRNMQEMRKDPDTLALYLRSLENSMTVTRSNLMEMVDLLEPGAYGFLLHSHNSSALVDMVKNRFVVDGAFAGRVKSRAPTAANGYQTGNYNHVIPDYHGILKHHQFGATPLDPSWKIVESVYLRGKDRKDWYRLEKTVEGRAKQVEILNEFLEKNPIDDKNEMWQQFFRSPIQHFTNPHILKVGYFLGREYGDIVFVHQSLMPKLEFDMDGDAFTGRKWNMDITKDLIDLQWQKNSENDYEYSEQYLLQSYETPLDGFADPESSFTPTTGNVIKEIANNFETGTQVGMVTNARAMRSSLNHKGVQIEFEGDLYRNAILVPRMIDEVVIMDYAPLKEDFVPSQGDSIAVIDGVNYLQTTSDRELTIIQQASFDESKKGLLSFWWSQLKGRQSSIGKTDNFTSFVRSRVFKVIDKDSLKELTKGNDEAQKLVRVIVTHFKTSDIRQGRNAFQNNMRIGELTEESHKVYDRINSLSLLC